jgi:hypothetical protein
LRGGTKGLTLDAKDLKLTVVDVIDGDWQAAGVIVHDVTNRGIAMMLVDMTIEDGFPIALGVLFDHPRPTFDRAVIEQNQKASAGKSPDLQKLLNTGQTWTVGKAPFVSDLAPRHKDTKESDAIPWCLCVLVEAVYSHSMTSILWFRQDLRLHDNPALSAACAEGAVVPVYILDDDTPGDRRMGGRAAVVAASFALARLKETLPGLILRRGDCAAQLAALASETGATRIHANRQYEPWWQEADSAVAADFDLVLHHGNQLAPPASVLTGAGTRYRVFTPWWKQLLTQMPPRKPLPVPAIRCVTAPWTPMRWHDWHLRPTRPDWAGGFLCLDARRRWRTRRAARLPAASQNL